MMQSQDMKTKIKLVKDVSEIKVLRKICKKSIEETDVRKMVRKKYKY